MKNILLVLLIGFPMAHASPFRIFDKTKGERYLQFYDREFLADILHQKMDLERAQTLSLESFRKVTQQILNCPSLTDDKIVRECVEKFKSTSTQVFIQIPFLNGLFEVNDPLNQFIEQLNRFIPQIKASSHPMVQEVMNSWQRKNFAITPYSFRNEALEKKLQEYLHMFSLFPKVERESEAKNCLVQAREDMMGVSSFSQNQEQFVFVDGIEAQKCFTYMEGLLHLIINLPFLEANRGGQEVPISPLNDYYVHEIHKVLLGGKPEEALTAIKLKVFKAGEVFNLAQYHLVNHLADSMARRLFSAMNPTQVLSSFLEFFDKKTIKDFVRYDGVLGIHHYQDQKLALITLYLAHLIENRREGFEDAVRELSLEDAFKDSNTIDEMSRLEPIDLIKNMLYRQIKVEGPHRFDTGLIDFIGENIQFMAGSKNQIDHPLYILPRGAEDEFPYYLCSKGDNSDTSKQQDHLQGFSNDFFEMLRGNKMVESQNAQNQPIWTFSTEDFEQELFCAGEKYNLKKEKRVSPPLKRPNPMVIQDGYIDILVPYSLTLELDETFKKLIKIYFSSLGHSLSKKRITDTRSYLSSELVTADVLLPTGHSLASRNLNIGTKEAEVWTLTRARRKGEQFGIRLKLILPDPQTPKISMSSDELAKAYVERIKSTSAPLFVFVMSCHSENNLETWSLIYRKALHEVGEDQGMLPYVMASKRGFATSNHVEVANNVFFPTDVADFLAQGKSPGDIFKLLEEKIYKSLAEEYLKRLGQHWSLVLAQAYQPSPYQMRGDGEAGPDDFWKMMKSIFSNEKPSSFEPVYNLAPDRVQMTLKMTGTRYILRHDDQIIQDDTY